MKILEVTSLSIPDVRVVRFARFRDDRGYFTESYRQSDFDSIDFLDGLSFTQANESFSRPGVVRGLHFQWNPYMGKLVRTVGGRMVDLALDVRLGSPTFGKIVAHDMPVTPEVEWSEWIWVPPGFAHGNFFTEETTIEYFCTGEYSPGCEGAVSPLADDIDWSLCDQGLAAEFRELAGGQLLISEKDRDAGSLAEWEVDANSDRFRYAELARSET